jgi:deazaflavin-dependent oxidoreductase (nitroreductase family)
MLNIRLLIRLFSLIHQVVYRLSGGRIGSQIVGAPVLLLTSKGRKSGKERTTPLLYLDEGRDWIVAGSNAGDDRHPAWWLNLKIHPVATVQIGGSVKRVRAREASEEEKTFLWPRFVDMYADYEVYQQRTVRKIPIVILETNAE